MTQPAELDELRRARRRAEGRLHRLSALGEQWHAEHGRVRRKLTEVRGFLDLSLIHI